MTAQAINPVEPNVLPTNSSLKHPKSASSSARMATITMSRRAPAVNARSSAKPALVEPTQTALSAVLHSSLTTNCFVLVPARTEHSIMAWPARTARSGASTARLTSLNARLAGVTEKIRLFALVTTGTMTMARTRLANNARLPASIANL